jgi:lipopolysaccharide transport system permease protein
MTFTVLCHAVIAIAVWFVGYALLFGMPKPTAVLFPAILLCFMPLLLGIGWLLAALGVVVRDIGQLTAMLSHALLFLTPIFYSVDAVPSFLQPVMILNPLTFVIEQLRLVLFYGGVPVLRAMAAYFLLGVVFAWASYGLFRRLRPRFADLV